MEYGACILTIFCNTVAIFFSNSNVKLFNAHSRDSCGYACCEGTSVLLEFCSLKELVYYLQRFYSDNRVVPFDAVGVNVSRVIPEEVIVEC